jgi:hypothetical protein
MQENFFSIFPRRVFKCWSCNQTETRLYCLSQMSATTKTAEQAEKMSNDRAS